MTSHVSFSLALLIVKGYFDNKPNKNFKKKLHFCKGNIDFSKPVYISYTSQRLSYHSINALLRVIQLPVPLISIA